MHAYEYGPNSLYLMTSECREEWSHEVATFDGLRISITFRSILPAVLQSLSTTPVAQKAQIRTLMFPPKNSPDDVKDIIACKLSQLCKILFL